MKKSIGCLGAASALALGVLVAPGAAVATTPSPTSVTFTGEAPGAKPNGYASTEFPGMLFSDTLGSDLVVGDYGDQTHGLGLATWGDDGSALEIRLNGPTTSISMAFGNDDPNFTNGTDQAELTLYRGANQVDQVDVNVNANDLMDQRIGYAGGRLFNRATFQYVDAAGAPKNLIEMVDDIQLAPLCTIAGAGGNNLLIGTPARDVICGDEGNDVIQGGGGDDLIYPGPGRDRAEGGPGVDTIIAGRGNDNVIGGRGADDLRGGPGRDRLAGNSGADWLRGGSGRDRCYGGSGHDHSRSCAVRRSIP